MRMALATYRISPQLAKEIYEYQSPVPLFSSGTEAAEHGMRGIESPSEEASRIREKIIRLRSDIEYG